MKTWTKKAIKKGWEKLKPRPEMSKKHRVLRYGIIGALGFIVIGCVSTFLYALWILFTFNPADAQAKDSTQIMDREGNLLYTIHGEENRESLKSLDEISPSLIDATLAIEDDEFYEHMGIDVPALIKAVLSEIGIGIPRGGSTITQQLARNAMLSLEHSYIRKYREIIIALVMEVKFSKDEILLMYLNEIPYGNNAYGVELAAKRYFEKDAKDLTLAESAILAGIPNKPTRYSPYGNYKYSVLAFELTEESLNGRTITGEEDLETDEFTRGLLGTTFTMPDGSTFYIKGRSDLVLDRMLGLDMISQSEYDTALAGIQTLAFTNYNELDTAEHFVLWVKQQLEDKYGADVVEQGGLRVYTTLDPDFQKAAEEAIEEKKETLADTYGASNAALVSVQPQTGQILAMVGSSDFNNQEIDGQVNMITSSRQPGSSFKPFVYSLALLNQYTAATVFYDVRTHFGSYAPDNFDGGFLGPISMRYALGKSRNIPAVKAYFLAGEEDDIVDFAKKFGFDGLHDNYGPSLALGTAEVTPLEMAEAYSVFANNGTRVELSSILKIETTDGKVLEQWDETKVEKTEVLDPQVAYIINDILSDSNAGLGPNMYLSAINNAAKTGTSNVANTNLPNNNWVAAYTPTLVTIGWAGNADGSALFTNGESYSTIAPIWKNYMSKVLDRLEPTEWQRPAGIKEVAVSKASGKLAGENTPADMIATEIFANFAVPTEIDDAYVKVKIETVTNRLATEYSPEDCVEERSYRVYKEDWSNWQSDINVWAATQEGKQPPTESATDIHNAETASNIPEIAIVSPSSLSSLNREERLHDTTVEILDEGNGVDRVEYYIDGDLRYTSPKYPYDGVIALPINISAGSVIEVTAKVIDQYGYSSESTIQLRITDGEEDADTPDTTSTTSDLDVDLPRRLLQ
ncbi:MAG: transglycosylase domain-containing protein [Candidatus Gracilibacteria bacterium]